MSVPLNRIRPEVGLWVPATRLKKVVLPAPLGPMMALILPCSNSALTLLTAVRPPKRLVMFSILSIGLGLLSGVRRSAAGGFRLLRGTLCQPLLHMAHDAAREEDHQQHQQRTEHDHPVVLQELQILRYPGDDQG